MRLKTLTATLLSLVAFSTTVFSTQALAQDGLVHGPAPLGEAATNLIAFLGTSAGRSLLVLAAGLCALRVYYAARSAISVRTDVRLGPPRGPLAGWFAKKRLEQLVRLKRYEEAADLLQAWEPGRALESAELYIKAKRYTRAAALLVANNRLRRAAETYVQAGAYDLAAELFEKAEELARAEENYVRAGNMLAAARLLAQAGKPERAARYFVEAQSPREAGEQLERAGKKREAVEQYIEALALLDRATNSDIGVRRGERQIGQDRLRDELCEKILKLYSQLGDTEGQIGVLIDQDRPAEAASLLQSTGRHSDAVRLLLEHDLLPQAVAALDAAGAGPDTRHRLLAIRPI